MHVRPDSLITIEETSEDPSTKARKVAWHISSGEVNFQTVRKNVPGSATEVSTPTVKGTVGEMAERRDPRGRDGRQRHPALPGVGSKWQTKGGQTVELGASEAVKVDAAGKAGPKVALPAVPGAAGAAPPGRDHLSGPGAGHDPAGLEARARRRLLPLMLDYSAYFNRPLVDRKGIKDNSAWSCGAWTWASTTGGSPRSTRTARGGLLRLRALHGRQPRAARPATARRRPS